MKAFFLSISINSITMLILLGFRWFGINIIQVIDFLRCKGPKKDPSGGMMLSNFSSSSKE
jgi:hypothetical protein